MNLQEEEPEERVFTLTVNQPELLLLGNVAESMRLNFPSTSYAREKLEEFVALVSATLGIEPKGF